MKKLENITFEDDKELQDLEGRMFEDKKFITILYEKDGFFERQEVYKKVNRGFYIKTELVQCLKHEPTDCPFNHDDEWVFREYKNGEEHGLRRYYRADGRLYLVADYKDNKQDGYCVNIDDWGGLRVSYFVNDNQSRILSTDSTIYVPARIINFINKHKNIYSEINKHFKNVKIKLIERKLQDVFNEEPHLLF